MANVIRRIKANSAGASGDSGADLARASTRKISAKTSDEASRDLDKISAKNNAADLSEKSRELENLSVKSYDKSVKIAKIKARAERNLAKKSREKTPKDPTKKAFILLRPFFATGRYVRDSWRELRRVNWPSRRATWILTLAVILFSTFFAVFVLLFDWIFQWVVKGVIL